MDAIEEIVVIDNGEVSNIAWGDGDFANTAYLLGLRGHLYSFDVQIGGAPDGA
jgi:hypothetical protein